jgi:hypothetical protein
MITIYKYPFEVQDEFQLQLPKGRKILHVDSQPGVGLCLWAMVDNQAPLVPETFHVFGTGMRIDADLAGEIEHIATFQVRPFVWHLFRRLPVFESVARALSGT